MNWIKTGRTATKDGSVTIYEAEGHPALRIESRKRQIPHAARGGTWAFTSYFVILDGKELMTICSMAHIPVDEMREAIQKGGAE